MSPGPAWGGLLVFAGGGTGAVLRYWAGRLVVALGGAPPIATLFINILGCFGMGLLAGLIGGRSSADPWRLLLGTGLAGGFTTFSAFSLDATFLWQRGPGLAAAYVGGSVGLSVAAFVAGMALARPA